MIAYEGPIGWLPGRPQVPVRGTGQGRHRCLREMRIARPLVAPQGAGLKIWHAAVCIILGFYLASTSFAPYISRKYSEVP